MQVDANLVIDKLCLQIAQQTKEIAMLKTSVEILKHQLEKQQEEQAE